MLRVLIIDDESNIRAMINEIVKNFCEHAEVVGQAGSVKEGLEKITADRADRATVVGDGTVGGDMVDDGFWYFG